MGWEGAGGRIAGEDFAKEVMDTIAIAEEEEDTVPIVEGENHSILVLP